MSATIKIKNSSTAGAAPTSSDLVQGELAVNVTDKRLYTENASGTVVELGTNPSVPVTFPDGSASAPSLTNDGDTNTGLFFPAADTIALTTGGTECLRLDSSGNLGLGVTPSSWSSSGNLQIKGSGLDGGIASANQYLVIGANGYYNAGWKYITTGNATLYQQSTGQHQWYNAASGTAGNTISFTQAMTLDASGNLGIGVTSPAAKLDVAAGSSSTFAKFSSSNADPYFRIQNTSAGGKDWVIYSSGTGSSLPGTFRLFNNTDNLTAFTVDSSGNFLVGTTSQLRSGVVSIKTIPGTNGAIGIQPSSNSSYTAIDFGTSAGGQVGSITCSTTTTSYNTSSDYRLKENIAPMTGALAKIAALKPVTYKWKVDGSDGEGFIAHELAEVCPDAVTGAKDAVDADGNPKYQGIDTSFLVATLTAAIQELNAKFEAYKAAHP